MGDCLVQAPESQGVLLAACMSDEAMEMGWRGVEMAGRVVVVDALRTCASLLWSWRGLEFSSQQALNGTRPWGRLLHRKCDSKPTLGRRGCLYLISFS